MSAGVWSIPEWVGDLVLGGDGDVLVAPPPGSRSVDSSSHS